MTICITLGPEADAELEEASDYYRARSEGAGDEFLAEFTRVTDRLLTFPDAGRQVAPGVRRLLLVRYPYALIYEVRDEEIRILAVAHVKRHPFYWLGLKTLSHTATCRTRPTLQQAPRCERRGRSHW